MKIFCLGGAGRIAREAVLDLATDPRVESITIADANTTAANEVIALMPAGRATFQHVDLLASPDACIHAMRGHDVVMDGTTISLNGLSTRCIAEAGCHGINLNGFGDEDQHDQTFRANNRAHVAGFGMTPGLTNLLAVHAADQLDHVESVRISHGAFRPIAFSRSIAETTTYEYDPDLPGRVVYENGDFTQVPPFARPREIELPPPYGKTVQYIIPHSETRTLAKFLAPKGVKLIEVRGTWPAPNMRLISALHEFGILSNPRVRLPMPDTNQSIDVGVLDAIAEHLLHSTAGTTTALYGYALHVEVIGIKNGQREEHVLTHTHPTSDGSVPDWAGLRAYTRCVGLPLAIGVRLLALGQFRGRGVLSPEQAFTPSDVFDALRTRQIHIHHTTRIVHQTQLNRPTLRHGEVGD